MKKTFFSTILFFLVFLCNAQEKTVQAIIKTITAQNLNGLTKQVTSGQLRQSIITATDASKVYYNIERGKEGQFVLDTRDSVSIDDGALCIVTSNGKRMKRIIDSYIQPEWFGAKGDGITDDFSSIQNCVNSAPAGSSILFKANSYKVSGSIIVEKTIRLIGNSTSLGNGGNAIERISGSYPVLIIRGTSTNYLNFGGIESLKIGGTNGSADFVKMEYLLGGSCIDLLVNGNTTGAHIRLAKCQDIGFWRVFLRHTGDDNVINEGLVVLDSPEIVNSINNNNDLRFVSCHFEHGRTALKSIYSGGNGRNNTVVFSNCKFELRGNYSINLDYTVGFRFADCRFTGYDKCFLIKNSRNIKIDGIAQYNTNIPIQFAELIDVNGLEIDVQGVKSGDIKKKRIKRGKVKLTNIAEESSVITDESILFQSNFH